MLRIFLAVAVSVTVLFAAVPTMISYQGRLTDAAGDPVADGNYQITFSIYSVLSGGTAMWTSGAQTVAVAEGLFNYNLGSSTPLPDSIFAKYTQVYLGIKVGSDAEITPRTQLVSVGYAFQSLRGDSAKYAITVADNAITSAKIADGAIQFGDIGQNGATANQIMKWNGSAWVAATDEIGAAGENYWTLADSVIYTRNNLGVAKGGATNKLWGTQALTHVNFGVACTTGTSSLDYYYVTVSGGRRNVASGDKSTIGGGQFNTASGTSSTVSGGSHVKARGAYATVGGGGGGSDSDSISALGDYSTVSGGRKNITSELYATVGGGTVNVASGVTSTIGGGGYNSASSGYSAVGAGESNTASGLYSSVGAGRSNTASGLYSSVGAGWSNTASGVYSSAGAGGSNTASGDSSVVVGGAHNTASGNTSTIAGGSRNSAIGTASTVGGGIYAIARGAYSTVGGGGGTSVADSNAATSDYSTVSGGRSNVASAVDATIGGGYDNTASGTEATIGGGHSNTASGIFATVGGGDGNTAGFSWATIGGGHSNTASGYIATVGGGEGNSASFEKATVGGGYGNVANNLASTVGGGNNNTAGSSYATVGGGGNNTASGPSTTVGGGNSNTASGWESVIGGGLFNVADGKYSAVGGGRSNTADGDSSVVAGGAHNTASGVAATVPGGSRNTASGSTSFAAGNRATAGHSGAFVWGDATAADFASTGNNQFLIRASGGVGIGTNSPSVPLTVDGGTDVSLSSGGYLTTGSITGVNITMDNNEIVARNNGASETLHLNNSSGNVIICENGGNVGIGTGAPTQKLHVSGNICYTGTIGACSDERYKKDVETIGNALETLLKLRGVTYNWKQDEFPDMKFDDQKHLGFLAQELKDLLPGVVMVDQNGYMSVDYGRLTPLLVEAMKQLKAENDELRAKTDRIAELEAQMADLKVMMQKLAEK